MDEFDQRHNNCQPFVHTLPDGTRTHHHFFANTAVCPACGWTWGRPDHYAYGRLGAHTEQPTGTYRRVYLDEPVVCPDCGVELNVTLFPCGETRLLGVSSSGVVLSVNGE